MANRRVWRSIGRGGGARDGHFAARIWLKSGESLCPPFHWFTLRDVEPPLALEAIAAGRVDAVLPSNARPRRRTLPSRH